MENNVMKIDFSGQVALVTGATRGIGKQIADDLADLGATLILTGTQEEQINHLNASTASGDRKRTFYCVDFTAAESRARFIATLQQYDKIDVCINNAGINRINYIDETLTEDWDDIMAVNLHAPFLIIRAVSRPMKQHRYGRIVNISSIFGVISKEQRSIYTTSKFGIRGLTVGVANDLAQYNVFVNAVSPGFVLTDLTKKILSAQEIEALTAQIPARRFATPADISRAVLFLASPLNTYITGHNLIVDGGYVNV